MNFLTNTYERAATGSQYLKFAPNDSATIRIISEALEGFQVFKDGKPLRWEMNGEMPAEAYTADDKVRPFAAFGVYHYEAKSYKLFCCATRSILQEIVNYCDIEGNPFDYTIKITRKGAALDTKYYVQFVERSEAEAEVLEAQKAYENEVDVTQLLTGGNPFLK